VESVPAEELTLSGVMPSAVTVVSSACVSMPSAVSVERG
jgi:hypothetical protein